MIIHSPIISGSLTFADGSTFTLPDGGNYSGSFSGSVQISEIQSHLIPNANEQYDLGSAANRFRDLYLSNNTIVFPSGSFGFGSNGFGISDPSGNPAPFVTSEVKIADSVSGDIVVLSVDEGKLKTAATDSSGTAIADPSSNLSGSFTGSFIGEVLSTNGIVSGSEQVEFNPIVDNPFSQSLNSVTTTKSIIPTTTTIDLGSVASPFRDLYLSSASLFIDGQQVISTADGDLNITTDANQSLRIVEEGVDTITLQSENGDITLVATGTGNIELNAPIQIVAGNQILSSDGNAIQFGEDISVTGNIDVTGNVDGVDISTLKSDVDTHISASDNPHSVTATQVGLGNVDNTSDVDKPVSTAQQTALDGKVSTNSAQALGAAANVLTLSSNNLVLTRGDGSTDTIDLSAYLDEDSRSIASGTLNSVSGIVTFTRDDASTFTLDLSDLLDDTNLVTSVNGRNGVVVTTLADYGITATAAEINKLDGVTATTAELNYVDGVTSNIQTQLNAKLESFDITTQTDGKYLRSDANDTASGIITLSNSTASTTKTTGALVVTGGVGVSGALNVGGDVVAYASSDRRLKDNIVNIENPIEKVQKLNGVTWDWNGNADELQQSLPNVGVIAQEVEEVFPQLVHDRDNGYKGVDYAKLTGLLIEAVKEQQKQIDELKSRLG